MDERITGQGPSSNLATVPHGTAVSREQRGSPGNREQRCHTHHRPCAGAALSGQEEQGISLPSEEKRAACDCRSRPRRYGVAIGDPKPDVDFSGVGTALPGAEREESRERAAIAHVHISHAALARNNDNGLDVSQAEIMGFPTTERRVRGGAGERERAGERRSGAGQNATRDAFLVVARRLSRARRLG